MLSNLKMKNKFLLGFSLIALITVVLGIVGIVNINKMKEVDKELFENMTMPVYQIAKISESFQRQRVNIRQMILSGTEDEIKIQQEAFLERREEIEKLSAEFEKLILSQAVKDAFNDFKTNLIEYNKEMDKVSKLIFVDKAAGNEYMKEGSEAYIISRKVQDSIEVLSNMKLSDAKDRYIKNEVIARDAEVMMYIFIVVTLIASMALGIILSKAISNPIERIVRVAENVEKGDFTLNSNENSEELDVKRKDETGNLNRAILCMVMSVASALKEIDGATEEVKTSAQQLSDASQILSSGAQQQAGSVEEITMSMNEVSIRTSENVRSSKDAKDLAIDVKRNVINCTNKMNEMLSSMNEINKASFSIAKIIKTIDEISLKTNILSLNAAIEAAKAGDQGKGFAVVAGEVGNLAERSAYAAKEITDMLQSSIAKIQKGVQIADETANELQRIVEGIEKTLNLLLEVAEASNSQANSIEQINLGVQQVAEIIQSNSAIAEENAAASEELASQSELLRSMVGKFKV